MKRLLSLLLLVAASVALTAAYAVTPDNVTGRATIYLNNGNVVTGNIVTNHGGKVVVVTDAGKQYTYRAEEVRTINRGEDKVPQVNSVIPENHEGRRVNLHNNNTGFWFAIESVTGYSCRINKPNCGFQELDVTAGYRFNEYIRTGLGLGARYYWNNDHLRYSDLKWTMPLYATVRGQMIPRAYRTCVPYYSFDIGATMGDGFMIRPAVGLRIGSLRSSFVIALAYTGQDLKVPAVNLNGEVVGKRKFTNFVSLKLGYEF